MLSVTEAAGAHLAEILDRQDCPDNHALRLVHQEGKLTFALDEPRPGDESVEHDGRTVLVVDEPISELLQNQTMDVESTDDGDRLAIRQGDSSS